MAEQLQTLLERIQKDGVDKADAEAGRILQAARAEAERTLKAAGEQAASILAKAEKDGVTFADRGRRALEQAARDVILSVGQAITRTVEQTVSTDVTGALSAERLGELIADMVRKYAPGAATAVVVPEATQAAILKHVQSRLGGEAAKGLVIKGDSKVLAGFRISAAGGQVEHDFTEVAITEALCKLLRPQIADIVRAARVSKI